MNDIRIIRGAAVVACFLLMASLLTQCGIRRDINEIKTVTIRKY